MLKINQRKNMLSIFLICLCINVSWAETCPGNNAGEFKYDGKNLKDWQATLNNIPENYAFVSAQINNAYDANNKIESSKVICLYFNNSTNASQQSALILSKSDKGYLPSDNNANWHQYNSNDKIIHKKQLTCEASLIGCEFKSDGQLMQLKNTHENSAATPGTEMATGVDTLPVAAGQVWVTQYNFTLKIKQVDQKTGLIIGEMVPSNKKMVLPVYGFAKKDIVLIMTRNTTWAGYIFPQDPDKLITVWYEPDASLTFDYEFPKTGAGPSVFHRIK